jgi:N6-L-threonylcarbamoyladenine synthase
MLVLGLESSCDETSVAVLRDGTILANTVYTQPIHAEYGGVVPEIASRAHIQKIDRLCHAALRQSGHSIGEVGLCAVTDSPGLAGALLVGISFALGLHSGYAIPVTGVNHLEGHIASVLLEHPDLKFPFLALVVSGGHTAIYTIDDFGSYTCLGKTIDDAAGEAFDKIGKLLGFPYPAGREIEQFASRYFGDTRIPFPVAKVAGPGYNFSFSGLKTAVKYYLMEHDAAFIQENKPMICHSFQKAIIDSLLRNASNAADETGIRTIALVGGVACNGTLRRMFCDNFGGRVYFPSPSLCTDNAAMIAKAGYESFLRGKQRFPRMSPSGAI